MPEVGFEIPDDKHRVCAHAELAWPSRKIVAVLPGRHRPASRVREAGLEGLGCDRPCRTTKRSCGRFSGRDSDANRGHRRRVPGRLRPDSPCAAKESAGVHEQVQGRPNAPPPSTTRRFTESRTSKVRTVRIDQQYRAVVLHPEQGEVFVLLWVDNHDEAMAWAAKRKFEINPRTGALQVINVEEAKQVAAEAQARTRRDYWRRSRTTTCYRLASPRSCSPPCGRSGIPRNCSFWADTCPLKPPKRSSGWPKETLPKPCGTT